MQLEDSMSAAELRRKYMRSLAGMEKYSRRGAWAIVVGYVAAIGLAVSAGAFLLAQPVSVGTIALLFGLTVFIGTRLRGINNIVHECSHATFSAHRPDNARIGRLCSSLLLGSYRDYCDEHLSHHVHLGDYTQDKDFGALQALGLHDPLTPRVLLRHILTPLSGRHLPYYLKANLSAADGRPFQMLKWALIAGALAFTLAYPITGLLLVLAPFVLVLPTINYWTDCLDHGGLFGREDELDASRNVLAPAWVRYLFFPRNDCYHLVHHLFPHVPARHLHLSHERLLTEDAYRSRPNAAGPQADLPAGTRVYPLARQAAQPTRSAPVMQPSRAV